MGLNITHTSNFQFESRENLRNAAKNLLARQGSSEEASQSLINKAIFQVKPDVKPIQNWEVIIASAQVSNNIKLKETLNYLKSVSNSKKVVKKPVLGEIWNLFSKEEEVNYNGELADFEIDNSLVNIFAA